MESNFSKIEDVTRLQIGDLIVVPSEKDKKRKRLHVSISTYNKMGISIGDTCRSSNKAENVLEVLAKDPGVPKVLYVSSVNQVYQSDKLNNMLKFLGNSIAAAPKVPLISDAKIHYLPYGGPVVTRHMALMYLNRMLPHARDMMAGKLTKDLFFCNGENHSHVEDEYSTLAYEAAVGRDAFGKRFITTTVPCVATRHPEEPMTAQELEAFMSTSEIFDPVKHNSSSSSHWNNLHGEVWAPRKFFLEFYKRGALFLRPSEAFIQTVLAGVLAPAFIEYEKRCQNILASARYFLDNLKLDIERIDKKIKKANILRSELEKVAGSKAMLKQFKEVIQWV